MDAQIASSIRNRSSPLIGNIARQIEIFAWHHPTSSTNHRLKFTGILSLATAQCMKPFKDDSKMRIQRGAVAVKSWSIHMKRTFILSATVVLALLAAQLQAEAPPSATSKTLSAVAEGNNQFALQLYGKLSKEQESNLFCSPFSISSALAMTYAGARGETAEQMADALHFTTGQDQLHPAFKEFLSQLAGGSKAVNSKAQPPYQLAIANRLWSARGHAFLDPFLRTTREQYGAELEQLDFSKSDAARGRINAWVEKQTQGKIKDLIAPRVLNDSTRLVLTNAIYFKGDWDHPFEKSSTKDEAFHVSDSKEVTAPLMRQHRDFGYAETKDLQILEMPYEGGDLSMLVLLPRPGTSLDSATAAAMESSKSLQQQLAKVRSKEVIVHLPRFTMTSQFNLAETLAAKGMKNAFDTSRADFSGMSSEERLMISAVIHKAFVEVNEKGTEAAAATAIELAPASAAVEEEPIVFRADRPFAFLIRHLPTGAILFMGRVLDPT
jgi:serpin B